MLLTTHIVSETGRPNKTKFYCVRNCVDEIVLVKAWCVMNIETLCSFNLKIVFRVIYLCLLNTRSIEIYTMWK